MLTIWKFRLPVLLTSLFVGGIALANLAAELARPTELPVASQNNRASVADEISAAHLASAIMPFRSDLRSEFADALTSRILQSRAVALSDDGEDAQDMVTSALTMGPHDSRLWLALAAIQARRNSADLSIAEPLKMSYLTGPNVAELIPVRLEVVTTGNALSDSDLSELARSDVRALLTKLSAQRQALVTDYQKASQIGKKFLEDNVRTTNPEFVTTLRAGK